MSEVDNKALLRRVFEATATGDGRPFVDALADDVRWTIIGTTAWSRTYEGKPTVLAELLGPLAQQLTGANVVAAERFIAEGDLVVVEGRNHSVTKAGPRYPNPRPRLQAGAMIAFGVKRAGPASIATTALPRRDRRGYGSNPGIGSVVARCANGAETRAGMTRL